MEQATLGSLAAFEVSRGQNLAAKDSNGKSDPYVVMGFCDRDGNFTDQKIKSSVVKATLNPSFHFSQQLGGKIPSNDPKFHGIKIEVWDSDLIGKDFMGQVIIPFDVLRSSYKVITDSNPKAKTCFELQPRPGKKDSVSGSVYIQYSWTSTAWVDGRPARKEAKKKLADEKKRAEDQEKEAQQKAKQDQAIDFGFNKWKETYASSHPDLAVRAREIAAALLKHDDAVADKMWGAEAAFDYLINVGALQHFKKLEILGVPLSVGETVDAMKMIRVVLQEIFFRIMTPHPSVKFNPNRGDLIHLILLLEAQDNQQFVRFVWTQSAAKNSSKLESESSLSELMALVAVARALHQTLAPLVDAKTSASTDAERRKVTIQMAVAKDAAIDFMRFIHLHSEPFAQLIKEELVNLTQEEFAAKVESAAFRTRAADTMSHTAELLFPQVKTKSDEKYEKFMATRPSASLVDDIVAKDKIPSWVSY